MLGRRAVPGAMNGTV